MFFSATKPYQADSVGISYKGALLRLLFSTASATPILSH